MGGIRACLAETDDILKKEVVNLLLKDPLPFATAGFLFLTTY